MGKIMLLKSERLPDITLKILNLTVNATKSSVARTKDGMATPTVVITLKNPSNQLPLLYAAIHPSGIPNNIATASAERPSFIESLKFPANSLNFLYIFHKI